jgi:hypothetical protein
MQLYYIQYNIGQKNKLLIKFYYLNKKIEYFHNDFSYEKPFFRVSIICLDASIRITSMREKIKEKIENIYFNKN